MGMRDAFRLPRPTDFETGVMNGNRQSSNRVPHTRWSIGLAIGGHGLVPFAWAGTEGTVDEVTEAVKEWLAEHEWLTIELTDKGRVGDLTFRSAFVTDFTVWRN